MDGGDGDIPDKEVGEDDGLESDREGEEDAIVESDREVEEDAAMESDRQVLEDGEGGEDDDIIFMSEQTTRAKTPSEAGPQRDDFFENFSFCLDDEYLAEQEAETDAEPEAEVRNLDKLTEDTYYKYKGKKVPWGVPEDKQKSVVESASRKKGKTKARGTARKKKISGKGGCKKQREIS